MNHLQATKLNPFYFSIIHVLHLMQNELLIGYAELVLLLDILLFLKVNFKVSSHLGTLFYVTNQT